jgi:hypothetical protein
MEVAIGAARGVYWCAHRPGKQIVKEFFRQAEVSFILGVTV